MRFPQWHACSHVPCVPPCCACNHVCACLHDGHDALQPSHHATPVVVACCPQSRCARTAVQPAGGLRSGCYGHDAACCRRAACMRAAACTHACGRARRHAGCRPAGCGSLTPSRSLVFVVPLKNLSKSPAAFSLITRPRRCRKPPPAALLSVSALANTCKTGTPRHVLLLCGLQADRRPKQSGHTEGGSPWRHSAMERSNATAVRQQHSLLTRTGPRLLHAPNADTCFAVCEAWLHAAAPLSALPWA